MPQATCHTADCENNGIAITLDHPVDPDTGQPIDPWLIVCGVCGQPITDLTE